MAGFCYFCLFIRLWSDVQILRKNQQSKKSVAYRHPDIPNFIRPSTKPGIEIDWKHRLKLFLLSLKNEKLEPIQNVIFSFQLVWMFFSFDSFEISSKKHYTCAKDSTPKVSKCCQYYRKHRKCKCFKEKPII